MKHYTCRYCGNLVALLNDTGRNIGCCGRDMTEITPQYRADPTETGLKHTPVITNNHGRVRITVGPADKTHPMSTDHAIAWVLLVTNQGSHRKTLSPNGRAEAEFPLSAGECPIAAFAFCNVHGVFVTECKDCCPKA